MRITSGFKQMWLDNETSAMYKAQLWFGGG